MKPPQRIAARNVSFKIGVTEKNPEGHAITTNLGYGPKGELIELAIVEAGKAGHGLQLLLAELGLKISRAIQSRNPDTGEELPIT